MVDPQEKRKRTLALLESTYDATKYRYDMNSMFLDSGAHSLYKAHVLKAKRTGKHANDPYAFYRSRLCREYVDAYCDYVKKNRDGINYFVTVDAIFNPELTWKIHQYIENKHNIRPVPVIHFGTDVKWVAHYVNEGHKLIGIGGVGQEVASKTYYKWADMVYEYLCPKSNDYRPVVRTHGFAMTGWKLLMRYPWWSVDSASWTKAGAFGTVYIPRRLGGEWSFAKAPMAVSTSDDSPSTSKLGQSYQTLTPQDRRIVEEWVEYCGQKMGKTDRDGYPVELGVTNHHNPRKICNLHFFEMMRQQKPLWPQQFQLQRSAWNRTGFDAFDDPPPSPAARKHRQQHFRIYYSGNSTIHSAPEQVLWNVPPDIMLTYYEIHLSKMATAERAEQHFARVRGEKRK